MIITNVGNDIVSASGQYSSFKVNTKMFLIEFLLLVNAKKLERRFLLYNFRSRVPFTVIIKPNSIRI